MGRDGGREVEGEYTHVNRAGFGACSYLLHQDRLTRTGKFANSGVISGFITVFQHQRLWRPPSTHSTVELWKSCRGGEARAKGRLEEQPRTNRKPWEGNDSQRRERGAFSLLLTILPCTEKRVSISFVFKAFLQQDKASQIPPAEGASPFPKTPQASWPCRSFWLLVSHLHSECYVWYLLLLIKTVDEPKIC